MAATAFTLYNRAKPYIGDGTIVLGTAQLRMKLHTSASNASTFTLSTFASINNEITAQGGYAAGGRSLQSMVWTVGASAKSFKLDAADLVFTASGADLANVKFAVIGQATSATKILCWSRLSTSQFTVTSPNTLTIQFNSLGILTLV
jgi:hypothetical protein